MIRSPLLLTVFLLITSAAALAQELNGGATGSPNGSTSGHPKHWIEAPEIGVDCTGKSDSAPAIQSAVLANPSLHLMFPMNCIARIDSTISIRSGTGISFRSANFVGNGVGQPPNLVWSGGSGGSDCALDFEKCKYMFDLQHSDSPVFENLKFSSSSDHCPDGFLKFDGNPGKGQIGSNGRVVGNAFENGNCANPHFVAVNISPTATSNHEDYVVSDNRVGCSSAIAEVRARDGVFDGTALLTASSAPFKKDDVGKRIQLSHSLGWFETSIITVHDAATVVLEKVPSWPASDNLMVVVGTSYGVAVRNGASQNALQQQIVRLQYVRCAIGIEMKGGNVQISQATGGQSNIGIRIGAFGAQNVAIDYYASESDNQAVVVEAGNTAPITITNSRFSNGVQLLSGHVILSNQVAFVSNLFNFSPPRGGVLIGRYPGGAGSITSINNIFPATWEGIGFAAFQQPPVTSINDHYSKDGSPSQNSFACWNSSSPCFVVNNIAPHNGNASVLISTKNQFANPTTSLIGLQSRGDWDLVHSFTAFQAVGSPNRFAGRATGFEVGWPQGIDARPWSGNSPGAIYGFRALSPASVRGGTVPVIYGLFLEGQKIDGVGKGWGIYQAGAADQNFFAGAILMQLNAETRSGPGETALKLEVVCGSTTGTAKLQVYAGTSPNPTTIADNVGAGVRGCSN